MVFVTYEPSAGEEWTMLDLVLAISHQLLIFGIFGILFAEFWV
jgi:hypothetical protein